MNTTTTILNHNQIGQKIKRIAYQIYEANSFENEIIIAGIAIIKLMNGILAIQKKSFNNQSG